MGLKDVRSLTGTQVSKKLEELRASAATQELSENVLDWVLQAYNVYKNLFREVAATLDEFSARLSDVELLKKILEFFKSNQSKCIGASVEHFMFVSLTAHALENETLDSIANEILEGAQVAIAQNDETFQIMVTLLKSRIIPKLKEMAEAKNYGQAFAIWRAIVRATKFRITTPVTNDVLLIATMAFKENNPEFHALAFKSWRVLIENLPSEVLRKSAYIRLVLNPLNRTYRDTDANSTLQKYIAWWRHVVTLEEDAEENFDEVVVPLLQKVFCMPSAKARQVNPTAFANPTRTIPPCAYTILALLLYDGNEELRQEIEQLGAANFEVNPYRMKVSCLAKHFGVLEEAITLVVNNIRHGICTPPQGYPLLLCRILYARLGSFYDGNHRDMVRLILSAVYDILQAKVFDIRQMLKVFQDLSESLPMKVLSSSQFNFRKGTFSMHECPALTLTSFYVRHVAEICQAAEDEDVKKDFRQGLKVLLERGSEGMNVLRFTGLVMTSLYDSESLQAETWLEISSLLTNYINITRDINQGGALEHDFSATLSVLAFPINGSFPMTTEVVKKWIQLLNVFSIEALLVKNVAPNQHIGELCDRVHEQLRQSTFSLNQLLLISQMMEATLRQCCLGFVTAPTTQRLSKLGHLDSFLKCLIRVIRSGCEHLAQKKLPKTVCQFYVNVVAMVANFLQDTSSAELFKQLISELLPTLSPILENTKKRSILRNSPLVHVENALLTQFEHIVDALRKKSNLIPREKSFLCVIKTVVDDLSNNWKASVRDAAQDLAKTFSITIAEPEQSTRSLSGFDGITDAPTPPSLKKPNVSTDQESGKAKKSPFLKIVTRSTSDTSIRKDGNDRATETPKSTSPAKTKRRTRASTEDEFVHIQSTKRKKRIFTEHQLEKFREPKILPCMYQDLSRSSQTSLIGPPSSSGESSADDSVLEVPESASIPSGSLASTTNSRKPTKELSSESVSTPHRLGSAEVEEPPDEHPKVSCAENSSDTSPGTESTNRTSGITDQNRENERPLGTRRSTRESQSSTPSPEEFSQRLRELPPPDETEFPDKPMGARKRKLGKSFHSAVVAKLEAKKFNTGPNSAKKRGRLSLPKFTGDDASHTVDSEHPSAYLSVKSELRSRRHSESSTLEVERDVDARANELPKSPDAKHEPSEAEVDSPTNSLLEATLRPQRSLVDLIKTAEGSDREQLLRFVSSPEFLQLMTNEERKSFLTAFFANVTNHIL